MDIPMKPCQSEINVSRRMKPQYVPISETAGFSECWKKVTKFKVKPARILITLILTRPHLACRKLSLWACDLACRVSDAGMNATWSRPEQGVLPLPKKKNEHRHLKKITMFIFFLDRGQLLQQTGRIHPAWWGWLCENSFVWPET